MFRVPPLQYRFCFPCGCSSGMKALLYYYGVYTTPDPRVAETFADQQEPFVFQGRRYKVMLQGRVHSEAVLHTPMFQDDLYYQVKDEDAIRPYSICIKPL